MEKHDLNLNIEDEYGPFHFIYENVAVGSFEARLYKRFKAVITLISPTEMRYIGQTENISCPADTVLHIPIHDNELGLGKYLDDGYDFIEENRPKGDVLIHCHAGISRSPSMMTYYLSRKLNIHPIDALKMVRKKRTFVDPFSGFMYEVIAKYVEDKKEEAKLPKPTENMIIVKSQ